MSTPMSPVDPSLRVPQLVMRVGLAVAFALMVVGIVWHLIAGAPIEPMRLRALGDADAAAQVLTAGVLVLAVTPAVQLVVLAVDWWRRGDRRYALVAVAVLVVLAGGVLLGEG